MQPPAFVVLPHEGAPWLHRPDGANPVPLCPVPASGKARFCVSPDAAWLGVLDQDGMRAHLYRISDDAIERALAPRMLADGDRGHAVAATGGVLYVGGAGQSGEMLWALGGTTEGLRPMPIPQKARRARKAVDALLVHEGRLLAIDDIVLPKWGFIYDLADPAAPRLAHVVDLPSHTSYEHVRAAVLGPKGVVVLSTGINHGDQSAHISILDPDTLREVESSRWIPSVREKAAVRDLTHDLLGARTVAVVGDRTLLAGRGPAVWEAATTGPLLVVRSPFSERTVRFTRASEPLVPIVTTLFTEIHEIVHAGGTGLYVVGTSLDEVPDWKFVDVGAKQEDGD